jgi:hypothetical protein
MAKIYVLLAVALSSLHAFSQNITQDPSKFLDPSKFVLVSKGDSISVRTTFTHGEKRTGLRNALRIAGAGMAAYQATKLLTSDAKKSRPAAGSAAKNSWLPLTGAGLILFSDDIAGHKGTKQFLRYTFYNKAGTPLQTGVIAVSQKTIRKSGGIAFTGKATADGFVTIGTEDGTGTESAETPFVVDLIPRPAEPAVQTGQYEEHSPSPSVAISKMPTAKIDVTSSVLDKGLIPVTERNSRFISSAAPKTTTPSVTKITENESPVLRNVSKNNSTPQVIKYDAPQMKGPVARSAGKQPVKNGTPVHPPFLMTMDMINENRKFSPVSEENEEEPGTQTLDLSKVNLASLLIKPHPAYEDDDDDGEDFGCGGDDGDGGDVGDGSDDGEFDDIDDDDIDGDVDGGGGGDDDGYVGLTDVGVDGIGEANDFEDNDGEISVIEPNASTYTLSDPEFDDYMDGLSDLFEEDAINDASSDPTDAADYETDYQDLITDITDYNQSEEDVEAEVENQDGADPCGCELQRVIAMETALQQEEAALIICQVLIETILGYAVCLAAAYTGYKIAQYGANQAYQACMVTCHPS